MAYRGKFKPKNYGKYKGDYTKIVYRSSWERGLFKFCDESPAVVSWSSEEVIIPYICGTDNKIHRYFVDMKITLSSGRTLLVEVKPRSQTLQPKPGKRKTKRYLAEVMTYIKNQSKWEAAESYAKDRGWDFVVWTEDTLRKLGIPIIT